MNDGLILCSLVSVKLEIVRCDVVECGVNWVRNLLSDNMAKALLYVGGWFATRWYFVISRTGEPRQRLSPTAARRFTNTTFDRGFYYAGFVKIFAKVPYI